MNKQTKANALAGFGFGWFWGVWVAQVVRKPHLYVQTCRLKTSKALQRKGRGYPEGGKETGRWGHGDTLTDELTCDSIFPCSLRSL